MLGLRGTQSPSGGGGGGTGSQPRPHGPPASPLGFGHLDSGGWWEGTGVGPGAGTGRDVCPPYMLTHTWTLRPGLHPGPELWLLISGGSPSMGWE